MGVRVDTVITCSCAQRKNCATTTLRHCIVVDSPIAIIIPIPVVCLYVNVDAVNGIQKSSSNALLWQQQQHPLTHVQTSTRTQIHNYTYAITDFVCVYCCMHCNYWKCATNWSCSRICFNYFPT